VIKTLNEKIMAPEFSNMFLSILGLIAGGFIGAGFGLVQESARQRNERLQKTGKLKSGWAVMPGSGKRVVYLLVALVLIQMVCPLLFNEGVRWWVSLGVAGGYGFILFRQLGRRKSGGR
jgi:hypothetical protein